MLTSPGIGWQSGAFARQSRRSSHPHVQGVCGRESSKGMKLLRLECHLPLAN